MGLVSIQNNSLSMMHVPIMLFKVHWKDLMELFLRMGRPVQAKLSQW